MSKPVHPGEQEGFSLGPTLPHQTPDCLVSTPLGILSRCFPNTPLLQRDLSYPR
jgi:hypothetical protein